MKHKIIVAGLMIFLLSFTASAQQLETVSEQSPFFFSIGTTLTIDNFLNAFGIVSDESVAVDALLANAERERQVVALQEQADAGVISQQQLEQQAYSLETDIEGNAEQAQDAAVSIAKSDPSMDVSDVQETINLETSIEPQIQPDEIRQVSNGQIDQNVVSDAESMSNGLLNSESVSDVADSNVAAVMTGTDAQAADVASIDSGSSVSANSGNAGATSSGDSGSSVSSGSSGGDGGSNDGGSGSGSGSSE